MVCGNFIIDIIAVRRGKRQVIRIYDRQAVSRRAVRRRPRQSRYIVAVCNDYFLVYGNRAFYGFHPVNDIVYGKIVIVRCGNRHRQIISSGVVYSCFGGGGSVYGVVSADSVGDFQLLSDQVQP